METKIRQQYPPISPTANAVGLLGRTIMKSFLDQQKTRLIELKDRMLDTSRGIGEGQVHNRPDNSGTGQHMADAASDACDWDFALSVLSKNSRAIMEINEAIGRIEAGTYGVCEISGEKIPKPRLEALPFARYTVSTQSKLEKNGNFRQAPQNGGFFASTEDAEDEEDEKD